ncbi:hypothetical protein L1281_002051 [Neisseria sp. HSC-16F19]|nr:Mor transcription activator family protein [Neisseria sp. HSC-16F19]MCP2041451.1 hypothetical protein [Neisseria sp. HSC-16F19]
MFEEYDEQDFEGVRHLLPESVMAMVTLVGAEAVLALLKAYGGTTFPVSRNVKKAGQATHAALAEVVGEAAADKLCEAFGHQQRLWMPKCDRAVRELRHRKIRRQFDELTQKDGMTAFWAVQNLAGAHHLTDRTIWDILKQTDKTAVADVQDSLF